MREDISFYEVLDGFEFQRNVGRLELHNHVLVETSRVRPSPETMEDDFNLLIVGRMARLIYGLLYDFPNRSDNNHRR